MGRNSRQRRAAKQRDRARRGPTPPRAPASESELIDDLLRQFGDDERGDGRFEHGDPRSAANATGTADRARTRDLDHEAGLHLDRLTYWATTKTSPSTLSRLVERELSGLSREVLARLDEVVSERLLSSAGRQWERG